MKKYTFGTLICLALLAIIGAPALAQWEEQVKTQLEVQMFECSNSPSLLGIGVWARGEGARPQAGGSTTYSGSLGAGDNRLSSGEYYDSYTFQATAGQHVIVDLRSSDFDTYVGLHSPSDDIEENDDFEGSTNRSRVELDIAESGTWTVIATSYEKDETGSYELTIEVTGGSVDTKAGPRIESGTLAMGDQTLDSGKYVDVYPLEGSRGEHVVIDLRSTEFDTYLILLSPSEEMQHNDDFEGDQNRSLINLTLEENGTYTIAVTSYEVGETGVYDLLIIQGIAGAAMSSPLVERGTLSSGDRTLGTGEYFDVYSFEAMPGQHARIDLSSSDFDTYLIVSGPGNFQEDNDDAEGSTGLSLIETDLTESGTYEVIVTSYATGETGSYELKIDLSNTPGIVGGGEEEVGQRDVRRLGMGESMSGRLESGDTTLDPDKYGDLFAFEGQAGQSITVELTSPEFDTYLGLILPSDETLTNDDFENSTSVSRIELTLQESGRYYVIATSYGSGETGSYEVSLSSSTTDPTSTTTTTGMDNIFGIFVGISDYPSEGPPHLDYCAEDATTFFNAMQLGAGMPTNNGLVLTDDQATVSNVRNALREFGNRVGPNDLFVFFYSGHGGREVRPSGWETSDPDGIDESIILYDGHILDNEMNELFGGINARVAMLVLDSCFSGGFAKDVICAPGRVGFFSSEEDVESAVARKFMAGGFLARFIADAVGEHLADEDNNGEITSLELSQYLYERYRTSVKSGSKSDYVSLSDKGLNYQHLVVDRYAISPYEVIFK